MVDVSLPKPYYEEPGITIYHADCREILPLLPDKSVDLVLTDPPYGISHPTNYLTRGREALAVCVDYPAVFGDDRPFDPIPFLKWPCCLFGANYFTEKLPVSSGWLVWDKMRPELLDQATAEIAWTNFVKGVRVFRYLWNGMIRAGNEILVHPTQKPLALMKWILSLPWTPPGTVLDPFMGSGTTLVAAKQLGRKAIGIEIEEKYCEIAVKRLAQAQLQFPEPIAAIESPGFNWAPSHICPLCHLPCSCRDGEMDIENCLHSCEEEAYRDPLDEPEEGG